MLWFNSDNIVRVYKVEQDLRGHVRASISIRDKDANGNVTYTNLNARFGKDCAQNALRLSDKDQIKIIRGGIDFYKSKKYLTEKGDGLLMSTVQINDYMFVDWNNRDANGQPTLIPSNGAQTVKKTAKAKSPVVPNDDEDAELNELLDNGQTPVNPLF